jgi:hypothetical protein
MLTLGHRRHFTSGADGRETFFELLPQAKGESMAPDPRPTVTYRNQLLNALTADDLLFYLVILQRGEIRC